MYETKTHKPKRILLKGLMSIRLLMLKCTTCPKLEIPIKIEGQRCLMEIDTDMTNNHKLLEQLWKTLIGTNNTKV